MNGIFDFMTLDILYGKGYEKEYGEPDKINWDIAVLKG